MTAERRRPAPARVLVVDDCEEIRLLLSFTLSTDDRFELVAEASDGPEAVAKAGETLPELIVLDQTMPGPSGLDVLPDLLERVPSAAVVIYTALISPLQQRARAAGAAEVIDKLTVGEELADRLASVVERRRSGGQVIDLEDAGTAPAALGQATRPSVR